MDRLEELEIENKELRERVALLEEKVYLLLKKIEELSHDKTSNNSSLPPSQDLKRKSKSLRKSTGRKSGGQKGHEGSTFAKSATPDSVIPLIPHSCHHCGGSLVHAEMSLSSSRQVVDIPPLTAIYTEYQQYSCTCPHCHNHEKALYPPHVQAPIQYGSHVESFISYLSVYQYLPYARLKELFQELFSLSISEGSIQNILERSASRMNFVYNEIHSQLSHVKVVGADETGIKVAGKKEWLWVWQNKHNTYLVPSPSRGYKVIESEWKDGFPNATLLSDRWKAQLKTPAKQHQLCLAHLFRESTYITEIEEHSFPLLFQALIYDIFAFKREKKESRKEETTLLEEELNTILAIPISKKKFPKSYTLQREMINLREAVLPCLYDTDIPPDNNASERAVRNVKVKMKVSGMLKTGQNAFCIIRSVIDTMKKRGRKVLPTISSILTSDYQTLEMT